MARALKQSNSDDWCQLTRCFCCEQKQESGAELATPAGAAASDSGTPAAPAAPLFADTPAGPAQPSGWDDVYQGADDGAQRLHCQRCNFAPSVASNGTATIQQQHLCIRGYTTDAGHNGA